MGNQFGTGSWHTHSEPEFGARIRHRNPRPASRTHRGTRFQRPEFNIRTRHPTSQPQPVTGVGTRCRTPAQPPTSTPMPGTGSSTRIRNPVPDNRMRIHTRNRRRNLASQPGTAARGRKPDSEPGIHNRRHQPTDRTRPGSGPCAWWCKCVFQRRLPTPGSDFGFQIRIPMAGNGSRGLNSGSGIGY